METAFLSKFRFTNEEWTYICEAFGVSVDCVWFEVMHEVTDVGECEEE